jgi:hypothetical protein
VQPSGLASLPLPRVHELAACVEGEPGLGSHAMEQLEGRCLRLSNQSAEKWHEGQDWEVVVDDFEHVETRNSMYFLRNSAKGAGD